MSTIDSKSKADRAVIAGDDQQGRKYRQTEYPMIGRVKRRKKSPDEITNGRI